MFIHAERRHRPGSTLTHGAVVDLAPIDLAVSVVPGSGNLRGNPWCARLPEGGGALQDVSALLNRLLNGLGP